MKYKVSRNNQSENLIIPMSILTVEYKKLIWEVCYIITSYLEREWVGSISNSQMENGEEINYKAL